MIECVRYMVTVIRKFTPIHSCLGSTNESPALLVMHLRQWWLISSRFLGQPGTKPWNVQRHQETGPHSGQTQSLHSRAGSFKWNRHPPGAEGRTKWGTIPPTPVADLCHLPRQGTHKLHKVHLTISEVQASLECLWIFICP